MATASISTDHAWIMSVLFMQRERNENRNAIQFMEQREIDFR